MLDWRVEDNPVRRLVRKFGSQRALALAAGRSQPAVAGWIKAGYVPGNVQARILAAARAEGIDLAPADFFPAREAA